MPSGIHTNPNCQCAFCKVKRGETKGVNHPLYGTHHITSEETIQKIIKAVTGKIVTKETCRKISIANTGKIRTEEYKRNLREVQKRLWCNSEYREKQLKAMFKGLELKPTKPEILLNNLLQELFPNQYKYVGDGFILIGYKNPDFINVNGQKKIIEMYGDYWHKPAGEKIRINHFAKYGYHTLIIWEHELNDLEKLKEKIIKFCRN